MSLHRGSLVVFFMIQMHKSWPFWLVPDHVSTSRLAKSTLQHTHTKTHQAHNNKWAATILPSSSFALLLSLHCHGSPWVYIRRAESGFLLPLLVLSFGPLNSTRQKIEWWEGGWPYVAAVKWFDTTINRIVGGHGRVERHQRGLPYPFQGGTWGWGDWFATANPL